MKHHLIVTGVFHFSDRAVEASVLVIPVWFYKSITVKGDTGIGVGVSNKLLEL